MKEQLILGTTAFLAKTKGCVGLNKTTDYVPMYKIFEGEDISETEKWVDEIRLSQGQGEDDCRENYALAITQGTLQKWIRENHNIDVEPQCRNLGGKIYVYFIWENGCNPMARFKTNHYETYEDALEAGLVEALHLLENV